MSLPPAEPAGSLHPLTVLEYSDGVAAAYCGRLLAMYGARVVLLEPPEGSRLRLVPPFGDTANPRESGALFLALAAGKESATLDLDSPEGPSLLVDLCAHADALVTDSRSDLAAAGLEWDVLRERFPRLSLVSLSPFGESGPYAQLADGPGITYALGGYTCITGDPGREPLGGPEHVPGYMTGVNGYIGLLSAILARERTGRGQLVEVSTLEVLASAHQWTMTRFGYSGHVQRRNGNRYDALHPVTYYPCKDGTVALGPSTPDQLERMLLLIGREDLLQDPRFATNYARVQNADAFDEAVAPWFCERTRHEVSDACQEYRVPCAPALKVDDLLDHAQLRARGYWRPTSHPVAGNYHLPGAPFRLATGDIRTGPAPLLGQHNAAIFDEFASRAPETPAPLPEAGAS